MIHNILILKNNTPYHCAVTTYPDGQHTVKVDLQYYDVKTPIKIKCRIKTFADLELLLCVVAALRKKDRIITEIEFMYLFGMRSDRAFSAGEPNYFRDVVVPIINQLNIPRLSFLSPHNFMQLCYFNNEATCAIDYDKIPNRILVPIAGDKSSAQLFDIEHYFHKERTSYGIKVNIDSSTIQHIKLFPALPITIMDDLCDGGATFIAEAETIKTLFPERKLHLFVIHGMFSSGFETLLQYYDHIYTTNSYAEFPQNPDDPFCIPKEKLTVIDVWSE